LVKPPAPLIVPASVSAFACVSKVPVAFNVTARPVVKLDRNCSVPAPVKAIPPAAAPRLLSAPTASVPAAMLVPPA
jgi:hypothetical protein